MSVSKKKYGEKESKHFYKCIINSLILFASDKNYFESLIGPTFSPMFELETEFDYAFLPVVFENGTKYAGINTDLKNRLLNFKKSVELIPNDLWNWENIFTEEVWIDIRNQSNKLLDDLGVDNRKFE